MTTQQDVTTQETDNAAPSRRVPIVALTGGAILVLGAFLAMGTGHDTEPPNNATAVPINSPPKTTFTTPATPQSPTAVTSPNPVDVHVRWHGFVTVHGLDAHKDLDGTPPRTDKMDGDLTGDWLETTIKADLPTVQIAVLTGVKQLPTYKKCRDSALARGSAYTEEISTGDVLCVVTSQGRIARLRTVRATQLSLEPIVEFDVTVWDPPAP